MVPRGTWGYRDPARIIADRFSAKGARTVVAQVGVLQQTLISRACTAISSGDLDVADLWASFSSVASRSPDAWNRQKFTPSSLLENSLANRSIAFPYRRLHVSFNATNCTGVRA
ncbi:MAG TPA: hypothetical protein VF942_05030 [Acidimicrobiales bacterium]